MTTTFWNSNSILLIVYTKKGSCIITAPYTTILHYVKTMKKNGRKTVGMLLLHDNTLVHMAHIAKAAVNDCDFEEINHVV